MKSIFLFSFLLSICYGGIWISLGLLVKNHLETVLSMIMRKPIPENLINPVDFQKTKIIISIIGILMILIGVVTIIVGLSSMMASFFMPNLNFNFKS